MGTKGRQIVGMDVDELLGILNQAFADEWLVYYQYWLGAKIVKGPMKDASPLNCCCTRPKSWPMRTCWRCASSSWVERHSSALRSG